MGRSLRRIRQTRIYRVAAWGRRRLRRFRVAVLEFGPRTSRALLKRRWELPSTTLLELIGDPLEELPPIILDHCCLPPYAGPTDHDDAEPLLRIAAHCNPRQILEFGTAHGNTVANLCRVCAARIYTVNALPEQISGVITTYTLTKKDIGQVYREQGYADRVVQIYANTMHLDLGHYLAKGSIDMAIIDACHDADYVVHDFLNLVPYMREHGVVLFHDTHPSMAQHLQGSYLACMKLRKAGFAIRHIRDTWWGVWVQGSLPLTPQMTCPSLDTATGT